MPDAAPAPTFLGRPDLGALLSFNAGFVDTVGFLGLQGLFAAHVTGNFVTLAAIFTHGTQGALGKILALPEFVLVIALARLLGSALTRRQRPTLDILLALEAAFLLAFFLLAVRYGPFPDSDAPAALLAGFVAVAAMALQNAMQRVHFANIPPTAIMTNNTTQAVLDAVDLMRGAAGADVRARFVRTSRGILAFALGCAAAAVLFVTSGLWSAVVPVLVAVSIVALRLAGRLGSQPLPKPPQP